LLGVGAVGAWQYYRADTPEEKARLHWYSNPAFWVPALLLVTLCFIKDTAGTALPTALKKPLDVAEAIENKISGLIAVGAFVPVAASIFEMSSADGASLSALGFAAIDLSWLANGILVPLSMIAFMFVFLASNAINVLILLSPFTTVDVGLKLFRTAVLGTVVGTSMINPWFGALWSLIIIAVAYLISGWSFRLTHFGLAYIWDFVSWRCKRFTPDANANRVFLSRKINEAPARTYGTLVRDSNGNLVLHYRPWLVLPERTLALPHGRFEVGRGLFYSEILRVEGEAAKTLILLPPRYSGHEDELAAVYGLGGVREIGLRAAWAWCKSMFAVRTPVPAAA
jgi:hypothetical protein